jgi:hypothetical protein
VSPLTARNAVVPVDRRNPSRSRSTSRRAGGDGAGREPPVVRDVGLLPDDRPGQPRAVGRRPGPRVGQVHPHDQHEQGRRGHPSGTADPPQVAGQHDRDHPKGGRGDPEQVGPPRSGRHPADPVGPGAVLVGRGLPEHVRQLHGPQQQRGQGHPGPRPPAEQQEAGEQRRKDEQAGREPGQVAGERPAAGVGPAVLRPPLEHLPHPASRPACSPDDRSTRPSLGAIGGRDESEYPT